MLERFYIRDEAAREVQKGLNESLTQTFKINQREMRFLNFGLGLGAQSVNDVEPSFLSNLRYIIALGTKNPHDLHLLRQIMSLSDEDVARLPNMDKGKALIAGLGIPAPLEVFIPLVPHAGYASQAELDLQQAAEMARLESEILRSPALPPEQETCDYLELLGQRVAEVPTAPEIPAEEIQKRFFDDHLRLARLTLQQPGLPTIQYYRLLKWGSGRGNRTKTDLVAWGLVICERKTTQDTPMKAGRPAEVMSLTAKGERFLHDQRTNQ